MPSKLTSTACRSGMSAATGCVEGSWSCRYAHDFSALANVVHASLYSVASLWHSTDAKVANDSFSHRSSHHFIVTRSPNHMCAISCSTVLPRPSCADSVWRERKTMYSLKVTHPGFSMAPKLNSGTKSWSYLANGYG